MGMPYWHLTVEESLGAIKSKSKSILSLEMLERLQSWSTNGIITFPDVLTDFSMGKIYRALGASKFSLKWVSISCGLEIW